MTYENFEKAKELYEKLNYIDDLRCLIKNSLNRDGFNNDRRVLAAIDIYKEENFKVTSCDVIDYKTLEDDIAESILKLLDDKYKEVEKEFKAI